ncbi:MAG: helix-turn-helix transcriptional regulator [Ktedonobacteraceae bacterium]|nr:helix-turn-helix transcriptional regulator [Ktedonobacteraceae bacterium]
MIETRAAPPLPPLAPAYSSAFTLRSIVDTVRRTKPLRLSDVSQALKHFRSLHQLTQRDLATLLGFDQSYISKLENGQNLRDLATLKHIATCLGIPVQWLGIPTEGSPSMQSSELIEVAPSVIRLSQTVRENGRADAAVDELWPLILRLDILAAQDKSDSRLFLTLAAAQAMLGVILGDLLPEEALWVSVHFFKKAVAIADEYGDAMLKAEVYRGCGNELRKHKQYTEAISYLEKAFFLAPDGITKGVAAALLARTYGEMGDKENFRDVIGSVLYAQDKATSFTPTFNPVTVHEVHVRGLLNVGQVTLLPSLLEQDTPRSLAVSVAPQWYVISQLTRAEAQFCIGKIDDGLANLKKALIGAELCKLPHQVQRAIRSVQVVEAYGPAKAVGDEAKILLSKLSRQTFQISSPQ